MTSSWFRYLSQTAPWLTLLLLVAMMSLLLGVTAPVGTLGFDLPESGSADSVKAGLVAFLTLGDAGGVQAESTLVFFDDARYELSDPAGSEDFAARLAERSAETKCDTLTLLADRRIPTGDLMRVVAIARSRRIAHVQIAEKRD